MSKSEAARSWFGSQALIGKSSSRSEHNPSQRKLDWPSCQWDTASGLALLWDESRTRSWEVGAYPACSNGRPGCLSASSSLVGRRITTWRVKQSRWQARERSACIAMLLGIPTCSRIRSRYNKMLSDTRIREKVGNLMNCVVRATSESIQAFENSGRLPSNRS